jgi:hypothetical protein
MNLRRTTPDDNQPQGPQGGDELPTLAELRERAKKLDEEVREHLRKLGHLGRTER